MVLRGGKSVRVLTSPSLISPARGSSSGSATPRTLCTKVQKQKLKPSPKRVLPLAVAPTRPKPRRVVHRISFAEEDGIGKRAQQNRLTALEERSVSCEVREQYQGFYTKFKNFYQAAGLKWPLGKECDRVLADFLDVLFLEGRSASEGEKVVAAVEFHHAEVKGTLVRSKRALRGWRKERPAKSRLPLPALAAFGMAMDLVARGKRTMGVKLLVDFDMYLRPGESIAIRGRDLSAPVPGGGPQFQSFSLIIRDQEDQIADKTGTFDNTILFNTPSREFLGQMLWGLRQRLNSPADYLYNFTTAEFRSDKGQERSWACPGSIHISCVMAEPRTTSARGRGITKQ